MRSMSLIVGCLLAHPKSRVSQEPFEFHICIFSLCVRIFPLQLYLDITSLTKMNYMDHSVVISYHKLPWDVCCMTHLQLSPGIFVSSTELLFFLYSIVRLEVRSREYWDYSVLVIWCILLIWFYICSVYS